MQAEILLTLKLQQRLFADPRRIALLKQIDQTGSISQGAKHAGISYKSAWDAINEMNQLSEQPLVDRATGGKGGGGAVLTRYGQRLIQLYDLLAQIQQKAFDVLSDDDALPLDSLLAAISRFSLQTSARNQWFGTITGRDRQQVQQHVEVLLADGQTRLNVAITAQSAEKLGLDEGRGAGSVESAPGRHHPRPGGGPPGREPAVGSYQPYRMRLRAVRSADDAGRRSDPVRHSATGADVWPGGRDGGDRLLQRRSHHSRYVMLTPLTLRA